MAAEERDEICREVNKENSIPQDIDLHEPTWQQHIYQNEYLGKHHDDIAETDPPYPTVFILVIILFDLLDTLLINFMEQQDMYRTLNKEKHYR
mgnify:FL=1